MDDAVRLERLLASSLNRNYGPSWLSSIAGKCRTRGNVRAARRVPW